MSLYTEIIENETFLIGEINGYTCKNMNLLCAALKETFNWPDYEICMEAMYHLDWCKETNYKIIVKKFHSIKDQGQKILIQDELNCYKSYWDKKN